MSSQTKHSRRAFVGKTAVAAATFAVPTIIPSSAIGKTAPSRPVNE